jgi:hypothetical protein
VKQFAVAPSIQDIQEGTHSLEVLGADFRRVLNAVADWGGINIQDLSNLKCAAVWPENSVSPACYYFSVKTISVRIEYRPLQNATYVIMSQFGGQTKESKAIEEHLSAHLIQAFGKAAVRNDVN